MNYLRKEAILRIVKRNRVLSSFMEKKDRESDFKELIKVESKEGLHKGILEKWSNVITSADIKQILEYPLLNELEIKGEFQSGIDFAPIGLCKNLKKLKITAFADYYHYIHLEKKSGIIDRDDLVDIDITQLALKLDELELYAQTGGGGLVRFHPPKGGFRNLIMSSMVATFLDPTPLSKIETPLTIKIHGPNEFDFVIENDKELIDELSIDLSRTNVAGKGEILKVSLAIDLRRYEGLHCIEEIIFHLGVHGNQTILMPAFLPNLKRLALAKHTIYPERITVEIPRNFRYPSLDEVVLWKSNNDEETLANSNLVRTLGLREFRHQDELRARLLEKYGNERIDVNDDDYREWEESLQYMYFKPLWETVELNNEDDPSVLVARGAQKVEAGELQNGFMLFTQAYFSLRDKLEELSGGGEYPSYDDFVSEYFDNEERALLVETLRRLIDTAFALDRKEVSCIYLKKYLELNFSSGSDWKRLGDTYLELGETRKALKAFRRGIGGDPGNEVLWDSLMNLYSSMNWNEEAELCKSGLDASSIEAKRETALELMFRGRDYFSERFIVNPVLDKDPETLVH